MQSSQKQSKKKAKKSEIDTSNVNVVDCSGMQCPGPILKTKKLLDEMTEGEAVKVISTDPGFARDVENWCEKTGNQLLDMDATGGNVEAVIGKGQGIVALDKGKESHRATTMVVFSGDMDKVMASMIIANGAVALGHKVTMFFTFWGLNALRKESNVKVKKSFLDRMFGAMMPKGLKRLKISKMNMMGMGTKMMKYTMKKKNVDTLESLVQQAKENGVDLVACTMSMDVMGIKAEELIDGITYGGVATYIGEAQEAQNTLFI